MQIIRLPRCTAPQMHQMHVTNTQWSPVGLVVYLVEPLTLTLLTLHDPQYD